MNRNLRINIVLFKSVLACGEVFKEHSYGACWVSTGLTDTCIVSGTEVTIVEVEYGQGRVSQT